jgi:hypothetical protein
VTIEQQALKISGGDGSSEIHIRLEPARFIRPSRNDERWDSPFTAATLTGAEFTGHATDGPSRFEANVHAPEGFVDDEGDRCLLASFEFHHVALESAEGGVFTFTGVLAGANAYSQDTYTRLAAGKPPFLLTEMADNLPGGIRYLPPAAQSLDAYRGWNAVISCWPLTQDDRQTLPGLN